MRILVVPLDTLFPGVRQNYPFTNLIGLFASQRALIRNIVDRMPEICSRIALEFVKTGKAVDFLDSHFAISRRRNYNATATATIATAFLKLDSLSQGKHGCKGKGCLVHVVSFFCEF